MRPIIDSHLDLSWNALSFDRDQRDTVEQINQREKHMTDELARGRATTSLPELREADVAVCLATVLARAKEDFRSGDGPTRTNLDFGSQSIAYGIAQGQLAYYRLLEEQGEMQMIRTATELQAYWDQWHEADRRVNPFPVGYILAMEGADSIVHPEQAEAWWNQGLRSVMLAHYGKSAYAAGTGTEGPLTAEGRLLLQEFSRLGMILDVTHLSEPGFSEALDLFDGPVMASHNNCHALVPGDRQFSDQQLQKLLAREVVIGGVLDAWMLLPGWKRGDSSPEEVQLSALVDHFDYICQLAGNTQHLAIGTDLDGGYGNEQTPGDLRQYRDLRKLEDILSSRNYSDDDINGIFFGNWLRFFLQSLPSE